MNTIDEAINILQAMKAGRTVQYRSPTGWIDRTGVKSMPDFVSHNYREKPEPRTWYLSIGNNNRINGYFDSKIKSDACAFKGEVIKVVEVEDE